MDVEGRRNFLQQIADFAARGRTVVLTTHYLEEADRLAHDIVVVDHGTVIAHGTPADLKADLGTTVVAVSGQTYPRKTDALVLAALASDDFCDELDRRPFAAAAC